MYSREQQAVGRFVKRPTEGKAICFGFKSRTCTNINGIG